MMINNDKYDNNHIIFNFNNNHHKKKRRRTKTSIYEFKIKFPNLQEYK